MISDKELRDLNAQVYSVDSGHGVKHIVTKEDIFLKKNEINTVKSGSKEFKVLETEYATSFSGGGFKGMAVAPITKAFPNGDKSQVAVVAAGTDPSKAQEVLSAIDASTDFGSDQLASAEIYLDSSRAFVLADMVSRIVKAGVLDVVKSYEKGIAELEEHWIKTM